MNNLAPYDKINCCFELNELIRTKSWFEDIQNISNTLPFSFYKGTIVFNREYGQRKYLIELKNRLFYIGVYDNYEKFKEKHNIIIKELDEYIIEIIDPILKEYDINNIIFEKVYGPVEYVRNKEKTNGWLWLNKFPYILYIK